MYIKSLPIHFLAVHGLENYLTNAIIKNFLGINCGKLKLVDHSCFNYRIKLLLSLKLTREESQILFLSSSKLCL
jgi:hypothetical protein